MVARYMGEEAECLENQVENLLSKQHKDLQERTPGWRGPFMTFGDTYSMFMSVLVWSDILELQVTSSG